MNRRAREFDNHNLAPVSLPVMERRLNFTDPNHQGQPMSTVTGADIIATKLHKAGCRHAFGIPGGEVLALMGALDEAGIAFHLTKHENAAGFMAEGAWHAQANHTPDAPSAPGILLATLGPGVANAINVVANAMQDRVPLIFLTGCVDAHEAETYTHQIFDHQAVLRPITKASFRASAGTLGVMMDKALAIALDGQPGPVHIDVPISVAENTTSETHAPPPAPTAPVMSCPGDELARAISWLSDAERPLVIAGVDAVNEGAGPALQEFCTRNHVPLITSYKGKGLIDENHPLCLGGHGLSPRSDKILMPLIERADCIILAGYDPIEMRTGWRNIWGEETKIIEITPVLRDHGMHRVDVTLRGNVETGLQQLGHALQDTARWVEGEPQKTRSELDDAFSTHNQWGPGQVFSTLNQCLPDDAVITVDSGAHRILLSQMWRAKHPRRILQSTALCTMGCALPLANGYKLASPDTPVCAFMGDAGLEMTLGELATLRDMKQPVIVCVLVDESLALIELKQRNTQRKNVGVDFDATDFVALAKAMGGDAHWISDADTLARCAQQALNQPTFTLLACKIDRRAYDGTF